MRRISLWVKQHRLLLVVLVLVVVSAAVVLAIRVQRLEAETLSAPIERGTIIESVYGIGTVEATRSFQLRTGVATTVEQLYVQEGDTVKRGQRLVRLSGVGTFSAPFAGTVTSLSYKVGETAFAQATILQLVDLSDRYLTVSVEQRGALRVQPGQKARINIEGMRDQYYEGVVESVYSHDNEFLVRIDVSKLPPAVLPQMTADVAIGIAEHENALLIPVSALSDGKVYVKRGGGKAKEVGVTIGIVDGEMAEVVGGELREGDQLVVREKQT